VAQFILLRRIVERPNDERFQSVKTLVNPAHVVSAHVETYTREGVEHEGTRMVLSIGKTMLLEESPDIFWERSQKRRKWWE
jgi:hypothetical protein